MLRASCPVRRLAAKAPQPTVRRSSSEIASRSSVGTAVRFLAMPMISRSPRMKIRRAALYSTSAKLEVQETPAMTRMRRTLHAPIVAESCAHRCVAVQGWVQHCRHMGGFIFIVLRDGTGIVQLVVDDTDKDRFLRASTLSLESVLSVEGTVRARPTSQVNKDMETGDMEIVIDKIHLLNEARPLPFQHFAGKAVNEETRLRYRYLDLRTAALQRNIRMRSKVAMAVRQFLVDQRFVEVETPTLFRATPEGAREFIVPSRQKGKFYALPQSPQQYKQLLMAAGVDRYFQLARCYRDEDNRSDRQPEFTQIDLELSFAIPQDVYEIIEGLLKRVWKEALNMDISTPFPHMTFNEAIRRFGSDKPDTRFGMELSDVTSLFSGTNIAAFADTIANSGKVQAMNAKGLAGVNIREIEMLETEATKMGAKGLSSIKIKKKWSGALVNHFTPEQAEALTKKLDLQEGDLLLMCASSTREVAAWSLGKVRTAVAELLRQRGTLKLSPNQFNFLWVDDFPLFDMDDSGALVSNHHPFTAPLPEDVPLLKTEPHKVRGLHYDIVLNGVELGGGSIRVHDPTMQVSIMRDNLKLKPELLARFTHLLDALAYGCPPHAGLAIGFDRLMAQLCRATSLRDVIAFPKANSGNELMTQAPGELSEDELKFYNLKLLEAPTASGIASK